MNETPITVIGRLTGDPEMRFTQSGMPVANFTVASNPRIFNKQTNEWEDKPTTFWRCTAWRDIAGNVAESLQRGEPVIVQGNISESTWTDKESGQQRSRTEIDVQHIGPDLRWGTAKFTKAERSSGTFANASAQAGLPQHPSQADPWATSRTQGQQSQQQANSYDEAPF